MPPASWHQTRPLHHFPRSQQTLPCNFLAGRRLFPSILYLRTPSLSSYTIKSSAQRREFFQAAGTRAVYTTFLAPRNSANCCIVCLIFDETSLSPGAPRSACTNLTKSFSFFRSIRRSPLPITLPPFRMG